MVVGVGQAGHQKNRGVVVRARRTTSGARSLPTPPARPRRRDLNPRARARRARARRTVVADADWGCGGGWGCQKKRRGNHHAGHGRRFVIHCPVSTSSPPGLEPRGGQEAGGVVVWWWGWLEGRRAHHQQKRGGGGREQVSRCRAIVVPTPPVREAPAEPRRRDSNPGFMCAHCPAQAGRSGEGAGGDRSTEKWPTEL